MSDVNICVLHKEEWVPLNCVVQDMPDMREEMPIQLHTDGVIVQSYAGWIRVTKSVQKLVHKMYSQYDHKYKAQNWIRRCKKIGIMNSHKFLCGHNILIEKQLKATRIW